MPEDLNIYVTTASNAEESSWGTYCPGMQPSPPSEFITCLGDLYSVSWMEDRQVSHTVFCYQLPYGLVGKSCLKISYIILEAQAKSAKKYYRILCICMYAHGIGTLVEYSMELVH